MNPLSRLHSPVKTWSCMIQERNIHRLNTFYKQKKLFWSNMLHYYISLLIIPCIIYYVTNKETLNLEMWVDFDMRGQQMDFFPGWSVALDYILVFKMDWQFKVKNILMMDLFHKTLVTLAVELEWCGLLWCFFSAVWTFLFWVNYSFKVLLIQLT